MENRIKECQFDLFADRTSATTGSRFRDNALRFEQAYSDARRNFARAVLWCHRMVGRRRARAYFRTSGLEERSRASRRQPAERTDPSAAVALLQRLYGYNERASPIHRLPTTGKEKNLDRVGYLL
jgi:hypothetical protein